MTEVPSPDHQPPAPDFRALDRSLISSIAWTGAAKWTVQLLSWSSTILVVNLLTPSQYGIVNMAAAFIGILQPISDFGIGTAIVQNRQLGRDMVARLNTVAIGIGLLCSLITVIAAFPIAEFFEEPRLRLVVPVMGLGFFVGAFRTVPVAQMVRDMRFRRLAGLESLEALLLVISTLTLAYVGYGYWSIVVGSIIARAAGSLMAMAASPHAFAIPLPFAPLTHAMRFGAFVTASTIAWYVYSNADRAVVGRLLSETALGLYAVGITMAAVPMEKVAQLYQRVAEGVISRVQNDPVAVARYLLRITEGVAMLAFPLSIGMALVADLFVHVVLGHQWAATVVPLRILALAAALRSLDPLLAQLLNATGHAKQNARTMFVAALLMPLAFVIGSRWGVAGVAFAWLIGHPAVVMSQQLVVTLRLAQTTFGHYLAALWPATSATTVMAGVVMLARWTFSARVGQAGLLAIAISVGAAAYGAALLLLHRSRVLAVWRVIRRKEA